MNPQLRRFFLIFFLIGLAVSIVLAVANASTKPADTTAAVFFGVTGLVMLGGALVLKGRSQA